MYQFVKAVCLSRTIGSQWQETNVSNILVYDIFANYSKVYLELSNIVLTNHVYVDLDILKTEFSGFNDTLNALLILLGSRALETVPELPSTLVKYAKYSDAFRSEYKVEVVKAGVVLPDNYPADEKHDLEITRPKYKTDLTLIHSHCLVSVNGYYHMTDTDGTKAFVYNGGDTMRRSRNNQLGILSFLDVGAVTKVKILENDIHSQLALSPLKDKIYFTVNTDLDNKSYVLCLGGYLVFPSDNVFYRNGTNSFVLDLNNLPYIERIYESNLYIDLKDLGLTTNPINPNMINLEELWSDRVIKKYLTLSQSFLAVINTNQITTNKIHLRSSNMPGMFTAYRDPVYPLFVNYGKTAEYWKTYEDGHWSVTVQDSFIRNYVISQQATYNLPNVNNNLISNRPFWHSRGYLLEIAGYNF